MAALPACRPGEVHRVLPLLASTAKYCPALRLDMPNSVSPASTMLVRRSGISAFSHVVVVVQAAPFFVAVKATVGPLLPETMMFWPWTSGVLELLVLGAEKGRSQSNAPVARSTPTTFDCVIV